MTYDEFVTNLGIFLGKEVAMIRKTLPYKTGLMSGQIGTGGFHLTRTDSGFTIMIDVAKVFYTPYVDDPNWRSKKTGKPKRTANFWNNLVKDRLMTDLEAFLKTQGTISGGELK